ncbi:MAG: NUDIX hydrolase [Bacteroidota bacterium]
MEKDGVSQAGYALRFACVPAEALYTIRTRGVSRKDNTARFFDAFDAARAACTDAERLLVLEGSADPAPPEAIPNLDPYRPPVPVTAAGGLVVRHDAGVPGEPLLLLIFRRGAWDLPKGKLDPGETVEACALREVREEVGVERLRIVRPAGTTVHGYPHKNRYAVKTTHWYVMETPERTFTPEACEGIEAVEWVPWSEAVGRLGYASLRAFVSGLGAAERTSGRGEG